MDNEKYIETQKVILQVSKDIRFLHLEDFIAAINGAESVAPVIDPTMYMAAMKNLRIIKGMAEGLLKFQDSLPELNEVFEGLQDAEYYKQTHTGL